MQKAIPYYRVSTDRQGRSGLGLEAQEHAVTAYAHLYQFDLLAAFTEVESGRSKKRPMLLQALQQCKKHKALLLIAKLDRLARNVAFISALMESGVDFIAVDNPTATKLVVHIMAAFAEHESDEISKRTKAALAVAKQRGVVLGSYGTNQLSKKNKATADAFAKSMQPIIQKLQQQGYESVRAVTKMLNKRRVQTFKGNNARWHTKSVHALLKRIELIHNQNIIL